MRKVDSKRLSLQLSREIQRLQTDLAFLRKQQKPN
jgi:hypothetical protein